MVSSDEARIRAEEAKIRAALAIAGQEEGGGDKTPIVKMVGYGRNDLVTIKNGDTLQTLKYKKAEPLLALGWEIIIKN
jgi:hypothetical protein